MEEQLRFTPKAKMIRTKTRGPRKASVAKPATSCTLGILPREVGTAHRRKVATHEMPSGLGGTFPVEIVRSSEGRSMVRIHMPGTEWHHWQGAFWVDATILTPIAAA